jgi:hypothetical protein
VPLVRIEHVEPPDSVSDGQSVWVRVVVTRPANEKGAVVLPAGGLRSRSAVVNTDLFTQDVRLAPGETVTLSAGVRFELPRQADLSELSLQVNPEAGDNEIIRLPAHPVRVVPSLERLAVAVERVCGYDDAVKVEVVVTNKSADPFTDVELVIHPADAVRAGPLRRRLLNLAPDQSDRFELVLTQPTVELALAATVGGERAEDRRRFDVPTEGESRAEARPFTFLEPRMLTTDRVGLFAEGKSTPLVPAGGVVAIHGGKTRYRLVIEPSHPQAGRVRVYPVPGSVEVEDTARSGREWPFVLTVVDNPTLTQLVRLDYDVQVQGSPLRGELYLSVRPTQTKTWMLALTAGGALTLKGTAALFGAMAKADGGMDELLGVEWHELFTKRPGDWAQLLCIPVIRGGLWLIDRMWRPFQEG